MRVNGVYRGGDTAVKPNSQRGGDAVIGLDARGDRVRFSLDTGYQRRDVEGMDSNSNLKAGASLPKAPDAGRTFLQPWTYFDTDATFVMGRVDVSLNEAIGLSAAAGTSRNSSEIVLSRAADLTATGDFVESFWAQAIGNRNATADVALRLHVTTGAVRHQIVVNANALETDYDVLTRFDGGLTGGVVSTPSNIYTPTLLPRPELPRLPDPPRVSEATLTSVAVGDTLSFRSDRVLLLAGARLQNVNTKALDGTSGAVTSRYDDQAISPAIGIVVKPTGRVSLYGNYIEGLSQGPTAPASAANAGQVFKPYKSAQYEGGVKLEIGTFATTLSAFQISRPSGLIDPVSGR